MGKKNGELAVQEQAGALAVPDNLKGGLTVEGQDDSAAMARLHLFQGSAEETEKYGDGFKRGDFIDTLERRKIDSPAIMVLAGFTSWSKWQQGQRAPVYTATRKSDVPPEDLVWSEEGGQRRPPVAVECVNAICIVRSAGGIEPFPFLIRFKRTGLGAFKDTIQPNEKRRGMAGKAPGLYTLGSKDDKGSGGQPYKRLTVTKMSEPDAEMVAFASEVKASLAAWEAKAKAAAADEDTGTAAGGEDSIPV